MSRKLSPTKKCMECKAVLDRECFSISNRAKSMNKRNSRCKACAASYTRKHGRKSHLERTFGISEKTYNQLLEAQGGVCAICKKGPQGKKNLSVDHCHTHWKIRGLLCVRCNSGIGMFGDSVEMLHRAIDYLNFYGDGPAVIYLNPLEKETA